MSNAELLDRFIAISNLYLVLKEPDCKGMPLHELAEYIDALDEANVPCVCPDQHIA